ncbi:TetR/AcrR family transcriptional regulator [Tepidicaulis sp.]|uniref:TetR/AcrR family transcriptional regulator n=1 Tax=Tepidicaulis sp. TaxID=1920809 RepID=UPI003B5C21F5
MADAESARDAQAAQGAKRARSKGETRRRLTRAAAEEFNAHGFAGTDTNKIARRAGFAPQTFYRWFKDKTDIFLAVYRDWEEAEREMFAGLAAQKAPPLKLAEAVISHHRNYLLFRRSLRQLAVEDEAVRAARAESRRRQLSRVAGPGASKSRLAELAVLLLQIERLCDGVAEGEFADLGLGEKEAKKTLGALLEELRRQH